MRTKDDKKLPPTIATKTGNKNRRQLYFGIALLLLWGLIYMVIHLGWIKT